MTELTHYTLSSSPRPVRKLHHISDIHIRLYQRLDEYEHVFQQFYDFLSEQKGHHDLIVITGDLLHHKNELSPECVVFTASFLRRLTDFFPVILIAGNHDALLNNANRMDSISAIVSPDIEKLHYLKASGYYHYDNIVFGVSSLLDGVMAPCPTAIEDNKTKVALFHGGVGRFSTSKGFMMDGIPCSVFDGYDMVLLGDIHLYQYLDKERRIAYAGSMISQNFSETDEDHGVLVWDVATRQSSFQRLDNPYAFCEAFLEPPIVLFRGVRYEVKDAKFPTHAKLRLMMKERTADHVDATLVLRKKVACLSEKIMVSATHSPLQGKDTHSPVADMSAWARLFFTKIPDWTKEEKEEILSLVLSHMTNSNNQNHNNDFMWELLYMEFSHMFGYGENNRIDFKNFPLYETIGVFGDNSAGKSSLLEIMVFLLYGHITRYSHGASVPREVIHFSKKKSSGMVRFMVRGTIFEVEKQMSLTKAGKVKVDEKLWKVSPDGVRVDMSEEHRKKTDNIVAELIGPMEYFLFTTIFLQQNESSFRGMSPKERKEFLYNLMDMNRLDDLWLQTMDEVKLLRRDADRMETEIRSMTSLDDMKHKLQKLEGQVVEKQAKQKEHETSIQTLKDDMKMLLEKKRHVPPDWREIRQAWWEKKKNLDDRMKDIPSKLGNEDELEETRRETWDRLEMLYGLRKVPPVLPMSLKRFDHALSPPDTIDKYDEKRHKEWTGVFQSQTRMDASELTALLEMRDKLLLKKKEVVVPQQQAGKKTLQEWTALLNQKKERLAAIVVPNAKSSDELHNELCDMTNKMDEMETKWGECWSKLSMLPCLQFNETKCKACKHNKEALFLEDHIVEARTCWEKMRADKKELNREYEEVRKREQEQDRLRKEIDQCEALVSNRKVDEKLVKTNTKIEKARRRLEQQEEMGRMEEQWKMVATTWWEQQRVRQENKAMDKEIVEKKALLEETRKALDAIRLSRQCKEELDTLLREQQTHVQWEEDSLRNTRIEKQWDQKSEQEMAENVALRRITQEMAALEQQIIQGKEDMKKRDTLSLRFDKTCKKVAYLQKVAYATSRDGLPMFLLENILPAIEEEINKIIRPFLHGKKLILRKEKKKESVNILLSVETLSTESVYVGGMEAFILDVAMKIAFAEMSRQPRSNVFFIDEGISALDKKNMENLDQLFQFLEQHFPHVFIISHLREATSYVRKAIYIEKKAEFSQLCMA